MDDQLTEEASNRRPVTIIAGVCLVALYILLFAAAIIFGREQVALRNSPTPTAAISPTPHILVHQSSNKSAVIHDDFSSNARNWSLHYNFGKLEVIDGKLILQSNVKNGLVAGTSKKFAPSEEKYYVQADFTTDTDKVLTYGLIFGFNRSLDTYYAFEIWPRTSGFRLLKYNAGKWNELVPYSKTVISPYPESTTLSTYFDKGHIELYINGKLVSTFSDANPYRSKNVGIFVSNSGYRLIVDDFFVYGEK